jgi:hypothetical protein
MVSLLYSNKLIGFSSRSTIILKNAAVEDTPEGPQVATITALNLCLSFDHRVADGAPAAAFLSMIVDLLENPMSLLHPTFKHTPPICSASTTVTFCPNCAARMAAT